MTHPIHAIVLQLLALDKGALPPLGELAHAAFYAAIDAVDPDLSAEMHEAEKRKDFALSPLYGDWRGLKDGRVQVELGQTGELRVSLLNEELFHAFLQHLLNSPLPTLYLGRTPFAVTQAIGAPGSHPWVGYTTLEDLIALEETPDHYLLDFVSPTAINWGSADNKSRRIELFPQPRMAIAGLRGRWDKWTGQSWGRDFEEWVERNVVVSRIANWQTQPFPFHRQIYQGGVGTLEYRVLDSSNRANVAHFNRLLQLAFYTGIGYKTTYGLGQVRVESRESGVESH